MKHSVFVKFLALALCAAFLMTAVGSGVAAFCLTQMNLYEQTVDELYEESRSSLAEAFASQIAIRYASQTLGNCPESMTDNYHIFNAGYYGYTLKDSAGQVLQEEKLEQTASRVYNYSFQIQEQYEKFLGPVTEEPDYDDLYIIDNVTVDGLIVDEIHYGPHTYSGDNWGYLYHTAEGNVVFESTHPGFWFEDDGSSTQITFLYNNAILYQINSSGSMGEFSMDDEGYLHIVFPKPEATEPDYDELIVYDNIRSDELIPDEIHFWDIYGNHQSFYGDDLGILYHVPDGSVYFQAYDPSLHLPSHASIRLASFYQNGEMLFQISGADGVGEFGQDENGLLSVHFGQEEAPLVTQATDPPVTSEPITENPTEAPTEATTQNIPTAITDNMRQLGYHVAVVTMCDAQNNTYSIERDHHFGFLMDNGNGTVTFRSLDPMDIPDHLGVITRIEFYDAGGQLLYGIQSPEGVGSFSQNTFGMLEFLTSVTPEDVAATASLEDISVKTTEPMAETPTQPYTEPITIPDTTTATEVVDIPVTIPQETVIAELTDPAEVPTEAAVPVDVYTSHYYDRELGQHVQGQFTYETMPEAYTVELTLAHGAYEMDGMYDLIVWIWGYRNELLYFMAASLLGFAITAVYLCCAAGRKKGREEVRAGGINCLSLDVYLVGGAFALWVLAVLGMEGGYYLLRQHVSLLVPFVLIMSYSAALIVVGFCFAFAAQFKTPGGYWWRNTLCFRCGKLLIQFMRWSVKLFFRFMRWLEKFLGKCLPLIGKAIVWVWNTCIALTVRFFRFMDKALTRLGKGLGKIAQRTYAWLNAFLSLLPVTWQWLITGGMLLFVLVMAVLTRSEGFFVAAVLVGIVLVVYGAHCFGLLLESAKRMSKGDLEIKVDDKLMVGSFKEFAGDLNNLADVAVVAAQKQMASERMKAELITNVSHDIKTPLTSIINYVDLLQKPHTEEEEKAYLEVLSRQSLRMKKLLEDLIEMSKASTGNMAVNISRINAAETITQALGEFADKLEKAQLIPMLQQPDRPVYIQADGRLTWRVLSNLLSNAVKYALPGTRVYIDVMELEGKVLISMKNISRESLNVSAEELMERFVRGDASRNTEGSGLGLNIAQSLMEIQKGKLELTVDGDLFKVTLIFPGADA